MEGEEGFLDSLACDALRHQVVAIYGKVGKLIGDAALLYLFYGRKIYFFRDTEDRFALDEEAGALCAQVAEEEGEGDFISAIFTEGGDDGCARFYS